MWKSKDKVGNKLRDALNKRGLLLSNRSFCSKKGIMHKANAIRIARACAVEDKIV